MHAARTLRPFHAPAPSARIALVALVLSACGGPPRAAVQSAAVANAPSAVEAMVVRGVESSWTAARADDLCAPHVEGDVVLLPGGVDPWDGLAVPLSVRRRSDGAVLWEAPADRHCPTSAAGQVAWVAGQTSDGGGPYGESVFVADLATGTQRCTIPVAGGRAANVALAGDALVITVHEGESASDGVTRHDVHDPTTCARRWSVRAQHQGGVALATDAGILVQSSEDGALALHAGSTGTSLWRAPSRETDRADGLLRAEVSDERLVVLTGSNVRTVLREFDLRSGATLRSDLVLEGGLGAQHVVQTGAPLTLARRAGRGAVALLDALTRDETTLALPLGESGRPLPFRALDTSLHAAFARPGTVDVSTLAIAELVGEPVTLADDGLYTTHGRFVPTYSVTVEASVSASGVLDVALRRGEAPIPLDTFSVYLVDARGRLVCVGDTPDAATGWTVPSEERSGFWTNAANSLACFEGPWSRLGPLRAIVGTQPLLRRIQPQDRPPMPWFGVAMSPPFSPSAAAR
jgi:hypothetical protein